MDEANTATPAAAGLTAEMTPPNMNAPNIGDMQQEIRVLRHRVDERGRQLADAIESCESLQSRITELEQVNGNLVVAKLEMAHLANHDFLTNMPNRLQLEERLRQALGLASRNNRKLAVIFLDIDRFKVINDTLGHHLGDELLKAVGKKLSASVRNSDTVSRQGGDEFVILLPEIEDVMDAVCLAQKIAAALAEPFEAGAHRLQVTVSLGISVFPDDAADAVNLMKHADLAMYYAKELGRNQYQVYSHHVAEQAIVRQFMEHDLKQAVRQDEFELYYQPRINLLDHSIVGVEALIRWHHPLRGLLPPEDFIATAEENGTIVQLTRWVLQQACSQAAAWLKAGYAFGRVSINISALDFHQPDFIAHIKQTQQAAGLPPGMLEIEITESVLMKDTARVIALLTELHDYGVVLAIDDFGTGFSSLSYLKQLPIRVLKIDQSFLREIGSSFDDRVIVSSIINLGLGLSLEVIAEGVETTEQADFLTAHGCHIGQGFLYNRPLSSQDFTQALRLGQAAAVND